MVICPGSGRAAPLELVPINRVVPSYIGDELELAVLPWPREAKLSDQMVVTGRLEIELARRSIPIRPLSRKRTRWTTAINPAADKAPAKNVVKVLLGEVNDTSAADRLMQALRLVPPAKKLAEMGEQGYFLYAGKMPQSEDAVIAIVGIGPAGTFHGLQTLKQLTVGKDGKVFVSPASAAEPVRSIMPAVPGCRHDVFVSYAHGDDQPVAGTQSGFVSQLVADLKTEVSRKVRNDVDIWWDHYKLVGDTRVTPEIMAAAGDSACIIVVASPAYLRSEWCDRERSAFCQKATNRQSGIFLVGMEPIDQGKLPTNLRDLNPYEFYRTLDDGRTTRPLRTDFQQDKEPYYNRLSQLVQHVAEHLGRSLGTGRAAPTATAPPAKDADPSRRSVLLLDVTDDLLERRAQLKDYLEQEGIAVLPGRALLARRHGPAPRADARRHGAESGVRADRRRADRRPVRPSARHGLAAL